MIYLENMIPTKFEVFIMFKSQLSNQLLRILGERNLTVTEAAELSNMSRNYFTNLLEGNQTASLNMLENICSAFAKAGAA